jgi:hypothetical protein
MKSRSTENPVRKAYEPPTLVVYGNVSELTLHGRRRRERGGGGGGRGRKGRGGGRGRGHGGSRS